MRLSRFFFGGSLGLRSLFERLADLDRDRLGEVLRRGRSSGEGDFFERWTLLSIAFGMGLYWLGFGLAGESCRLSGVGLRRRGSLGRDTLRSLAYRLFLSFCFCTLSDSDDVDLLEGFTIFSDSFRAAFFSLRLSSDLSLYSAEESFFSRDALLFFFRLGASS